jgi:hypothetical protein
VNSLLVALAVASAGEACVVNETKGVIALLAEQAAADSVRIKLFRKDIAAGAQICLSAAWERDRPITVIVSRPNDAGENPQYKASCPTVMPGVDARLIVTSNGDRLVCERAGG